ncbi:MAG: hypothetical protein Q9M36_12785 [Sulfurovum sp.]|nr:hypothetical protein [Sulfurovum sp.]
MAVDVEKTTATTALAPIHTPKDTSNCFILSNYCRAENLKMHCHCIDKPKYL